MKPILIAMLLASALAYFTEDTPGQAARRSANGKTAVQAQAGGDAPQTARAAEKPAAVVESPSHSVAPQRNDEVRERSRFR